MLHKFVRTPHVVGSRVQRGDHDLAIIDLSALVNKNIIVEEKVDGSNCGISFSADGELLLQSRGHYLRGGAREKQFDIFKQWAACHKDVFFCALGARYVMYGEWMYAKHTCFYDALPHYFMEFDILDKSNDAFLSTSGRRKLLKDCPVVSVPVIYDGSMVDICKLSKMIVRSNFISDDRDLNLANSALASGVMLDECKKHTDPSLEMEGLYIKHEDAGVVKGRYKYVRQSFVNSITDQEQHWHDRKIVPNVLLPGAYERMFEQ